MYNVSVNSSPKKNCKLFWTLPFRWTALEIFRLSKATIAKLCESIWSTVPQKRDLKVVDWNSIIYYISKSLWNFMCLKSLLRRKSFPSYYSFKVIRQRNNLLNDWWMLWKKCFSSPTRRKFLGIWSSCSTVWK